MLMKLGYDIKTQKYNGHEGKLLQAKVDDIAVARIGYLRWNSDEYKFNRLNNARLKLVDSCTDIEVDKSMVEKGIALFLFEILFEHLWRENFDTLIITQLGPKRKFYNENLGMMRDCGKITSWYFTISPSLGSVYEVRI